MNLAPIGFLRPNLVQVRLPHTIVITSGAPVCPLWPAQFSSVKLSRMLEGEGNK